MKSKLKCFPLKGVAVGIDNSAKVTFSQAELEQADVHLQLDYEQSLFPLRVVEENEQASEQEIACRVESLRSCRAASVVSRLTTLVH